MDNLTKFSLGFLDGVDRSQYQINKILANLSIDGFYSFLDSMSRLHPDMLHHVYEWDMVGYPDGRLYKLKKTKSGNKIAINYQFLRSNTTSSEFSQVPFYNKAEIMELGIPITIQERDAQALFFESDNMEVFAKGPIRIANPGGAAVRGSFIRYFNLFYNKYFEEIYLNSINFYRYMSNPKQYLIDFPDGVRSTGYNGGVRSAKKWIDNMPGSDLSD